MTLPGIPELLVISPPGPARRAATTAPIARHAATTFAKFPHKYHCSLQSQGSRRVTPAGSAHRSSATTLPCIAANVAFAATGEDGRVVYVWVLRCDQALSRIS